MTDWFEERLYDHIRQKIKIKNPLLNIKTALNQEIFIFESFDFGRIFCLDSVIQCCEYDEHYYHEILAHVPLTSVPHAKRVLIIGGASGAMAREVLRHDVDTVDMVDIDGENIAYCREYLPKVNGGSFDDPRLTLHIADAFDYLSHCKKRYDVIIVDSPDPIGPAQILFSSRFYERCAAALSETGVVVCQTGVPFLQGDELRDAAAALAQSFSKLGGFRVAVPLFIGGDMVFSWASNGLDLNQRMDETWAARATQISRETRYYSPEVHKASLSLAKPHDGLIQQGRLMARDAESGGEAGSANPTSTAKAPSLDAPPNSTQLKHLNILVKDLDRSWKFYREVFGFEYVYHLTPKKIVASYLDFDFYIEEDASWSGMDERVHFGLRTDRAGVFSWHEYLKSKGIALTKGNNPSAELYDEPDSDRVALYIKDPDGLTIEIYCPE